MDKHFLDSVREINYHQSTFCFKLVKISKFSDCTLVLQVVLPTFILERRSLLEMYADFFAHPDLFCR